MRPAAGSRPGVRRPRLEPLPHHSECWVGHVTSPYLPRKLSPRAAAKSEGLSRDEGLRQSLPRSRRWTSASRYHDTGCSHSRSGSSQREGAEAQAGGGRRQTGPGPLPQHEPPELPSPGSYGRTPPQGSPPWLDAAQVHTWPWAGCCAAPKSVCSSPTPHGTALGRRASGLQEVMMGSGLLKSHETARSPSLVPPT